MMLELLEKINLYNLRSNRKMAFELCREDKGILYIDDRGVIADDIDAVLCRVYTILKEECYI